MDLSKKATAMKELPARKIAFMDSYRNKDLQGVIAELRRRSSMNIVNDISDAQFGVGEITQLQPNGQLQTWRRNDFPGENVTQGKIKNHKSKRNKISTRNFHSPKI